MNKLIENVLIGGNHLANYLISKGIMPDNTSQIDEIDKTEYLDIWLAWRAIMDLSQSQRQQTELYYIVQRYIPDVGWLDISETTRRFENEFAASLEIAERKKYSTTPQQYRILKVSESVFWEDDLINPPNNHFVADASS